MRDGDDYYRMVDIQIVQEGEFELSVYAKPPSESLFEAVKPESTMTLPMDGGKHTVTFSDVPGTRGRTLNPYLSWHGKSGRIHTNGYSIEDLKKEHVLQDSPAVSSMDIVIPPQLIFSIHLPLSTLSLPKTAPPPDDFDGNYLEISSTPKRANKLNGDGVAHIVLDRAALMTGYIILDVMVHNRAGDVTLDTLPYPEGAEYIYVAEPFKIVPKGAIVPATTLFFYQPVDSKPDEILIQKLPTTYWGRSSGATTEHMFQTRLVG